MYFPYLRGKQFELIALRELGGILSDNDKKKISPIIEPVKESSTLAKTLVELRKKGINFNVIINPKVGEISPGEILNTINNSLHGYNNYQVGIILSQGRKTIQLASIKDRLPSNIPFTLIHNDMYDNIEEKLDLIKRYSTIKYNVVNLNKTDRRYYRAFDKGSVVELADYFIAQQKNSDYKEIDDSKFSEEHLFYKEDGFVGFGDYLTIGDNYSESGFLPYAIAIHLSYDSKKRIRIKHFVSDSNDDPSDIAGKFDEALTKLVDWCKFNNYTGNAVEEFLNLHETGHFPGLGSIKKLSIVNHVELVLRLMV